MVHQPVSERSIAGQSQVFAFITVLAPRHTLRPPLNLHSETTSFPVNIKLKPRLHLFGHRGTYAVHPLDSGL